MTITLNLRKPELIPYEFIPAGCHIELHEINKKGFATWRIVDDITMQDYEIPESKKEGNKLRVGDNVAVGVKGYLTLPRELLPENALFKFSCEFEDHFVYTVSDGR